MREGENMDVRISVIGAEPGLELESLIDWLRGESELVGRIRLSGPEPRAGQLGALTDALIISVGAGGSLSVLASSLKVWLSRPRGSELRVRIDGKNGNRSVELDANRLDSKDIESVLRQVLDTESRD